MLGALESEVSPGDLVFEVSGEAQRLQALQGGDAGELWLVFGDATNGSETYGGGRYLYTDPPAPDDAVVIDFNRAYNPPCVFSPYATCPLPWQANRLPIRIEAGERAPRGYEPPSGLPPQLVEVEVALDRAQRVVADLAAVAQLEDREPLGGDDRTPDLVVLQLLDLLGRVSSPVPSMVSAPVSSWT